MYLGIDRPKAAMWTLVNAAFVGDSDGSQLLSGQPRTECRVQCAAGSYSSISLRATWPDALVPRIGCIVGLQVPAGIDVTITGMPASNPVAFGQALGGNSSTQQTLMFDDGSVGAWWFFDDALPACVGLQITLANTGGLAPFVPGAFIDIGEVGFWRGVLFGGIGVDKGWSDDMPSPTTVRSLNQTPWPDARLPGRSLPFSSRLVREPYAIGDGGGSGINLRQIRRRGLGGEVIAAVLRHHLPGSALVDGDTVNRVAMLGGFDTFDAIAHVSGPFFSTAGRINEFPAWPLRD